MPSVVRATLLAVAVAMLGPLQANGDPPEAAPIDPVHEIARLERELAETRASLAELKQFIEDHHELGSAYAEYTHVKHATERQAEAERQAAAREHRRLEQTRRAARRAQAQRERQEAMAQAERLERYARAGFGPVGQDVFLGRVGYYYPDAAHTMFEIEYDPALGIRFLRPNEPRSIDFGSMTISGSVLNASQGAANVGLALSFFDEAGYQIGAEIIQVANAAPDVPYPFTTTIEMASTRPFATVRVHVLYADPVATPGPPAVRTSRGTPPNLAQLGETLDRALRAAIQLAEQELARPR